MPKRQCPFDYDLVPQIKIRVGQKEYDLKDDTNMSKVHDKTLQLLFKGAKQIYKTGDKSFKHTSLPSGETDNCKNISEFCILCNDLNVIENKCTFCDKWMCNSCSTVCLKCNDVFCKAHSLKLYLRDDADFVCLNCCVHNEYPVE